MYTFYKEALFNEIIKDKNCRKSMKALLVNVKLEHDTPTMHQQQKEGCVNSNIFTETTENERNIFKFYKF